MVQVREWKQALALRNIRNTCLEFMTGDQRPVGLWRQLRWYSDYRHSPNQMAFLGSVQGSSVAYGLIRWHDIGYEPFMDSAFVLNEAKRLLALPAE